MTRAARWRPASTCRDDRSGRRPRGPCSARPGRAAAVMGSAADPVCVACCPDRSPALSAGSPCPIVVIRPFANRVSLRSAPRVVVGIDPTTSRSAAIGFAFHAASQRGIPLTVLSAWTPDTAADIETIPGPPEIAEAAAGRAVQQTLAPWRAEFPTVPVITTLVRADPAPALIAESSGAALLVIGSSSRGHLRRLLCGSVSRTVLRNAGCPVAIVGRGKTAVDRTTASLPAPNTGRSPNHGQPAACDASCSGSVVPPSSRSSARFRSPRVIVAVTAVGDGSWLTEVAQSACRDVGGVPVELLGDYLLLLADAATSGRRPLPPSSTRWAHSAGERPSWGCRRGAPSSFYLSAARRLWQQLPWSSGPGTATPSVRPPRPCSTWCVRPSQPGRGIQRRPPTDGAVGGNPAQGGHHGFIVAITPADTDVPGPRTGPKTLGDLMLTELSRSLRGDLPLVRGAGLRRWRRPSLRSSRTAWSR